MQGHAGTDPLRKDAFGSKERVAADGGSEQPRDSRCAARILEHKMGLLRAEIGGPRPSHRQSPASFFEFQPELQQSGLWEAPKLSGRENLCRRRAQQFERSWARRGKPDDQHLSRAQLDPGPELRFGQQLLRDLQNRPKLGCTPAMQGAKRACKSREKGKASDSKRCYGRVSSKSSISSMGLSCFCFSE